MTDPLELARSLVAGARPGESVEVCVGRSVETTVRVHGAAVESLTTAEAHGVVSVVVDRAAGRLPAILATFGEAGVSVTAVEVSEPNLEAVFLHLTGKALRD